MGFFDAIFGGGSSETKVEGRALTPEEMALIQRQVQLAGAQIRAVRGAEANLIAGEGVPQLRTEQIRFLRSELRTAREDPTGRAGVPGAREVARQLPGEFRDLFSQLDTLQGDVSRGRTASPEDARLIQGAADQAIQAGLIDVSRFTEQSIADLIERVTPARGLRPGDSPIIDRGGEIVAEGTRQAGQLISGIRGQQAQQMLQFPLQRRAADLSSVGLQVETLGGLQDFQRVLRDNAFLNRMRLGAGLGDIGTQQQSFGLGLATGVPVNLSGTLASIASAQGQTTSGSQSGSFGQGLANIGALAGGAGALLTGINLVSSIALKEPIGPLDTEALRSKVKLLRCQRWHWKVGDPNTHCGPYAEDMHELFGVGNGKAFPIYDAIGVLFALIKALDAKLES